MAAISQVPAHASLEEEERGLGLLVNDKCSSESYNKSIIHMWRAQQLLFKRFFFRDTPVNCPKKGGRLGLLSRDMLAPQRKLSMVMSERQVPLVPG